MDICHFFFGIVFELIIEKKQFKMKNVLTLLCLLFVTQIAFSQPPKYDDLKILYADANYEKLAKVASGYTENDKTKKDILPYIWIAKGLYKISLSGTDNEEFKNAYKDAISYLGKGMKYDLKETNGATIAEHSEFIELFQKSLFEVIDNELTSGSAQKAYGWAVRYQKITFNSAPIKYVLGVCKYKSDDKTTARSLWQEADLELKDVTSIQDWSEADKGILKIGVLRSAAALNESRQQDKARALLNKVAHWFENDEDWKTRYDEIIN